MTVNGPNHADMLDLSRSEQQSMKFSINSAYPQTTTTTTIRTTTTTEDFESPSRARFNSPLPPLPLPQSPTFPIPKRSDSLFNRQSRRPQTANPAAHEPRSFTSPPQLQQQTIRERPSEASRLRALNNAYRSQSTEGRHTPEPAVDNFSRPRQPSLRRRNPSPKPGPFLQSHNEGKRFEESGRDRGLSTSSSQSHTYSTPYSLRPSNSIPDYHAADSIYTRQRNLHNSGYRPDRGMSRPDSNYSAHRRDPLPRPAGFDEESRSSFRSAFTTNSSFLGGTERSSIMTKSSSATSVFGRDEGMSVDDFLGMYEGGFTDSSMEETRPTTADSEQLRISRLCEAMNDSLMVPGSNIMIRDSAAIFRNSETADTPTTAEATPVSAGALDLQNAYFDMRPASRRPMTGAGPVEMVFDDTRDRYGFRKKNQHVSVEQYEAWNGPYDEYLARRRKKWIVLLKENNLLTDHPNRFPPKSAKVKRFIRKGIPPDWRGDAWFYYAGGPGMVQKHPGVYEDLLNQAAAGGVSETDDEIIERDLNRTFPDNVRFKRDPPPNADPSFVEPETPILQSLRHVLQAFAIYNPKIGYCQSLNFLAGLLLLFMSEEKAFWMLNIITRVYLPGTHEVNLEGANVDLGVLMMSVKESMPAIWAKIGGELDGSPTSPAKISMRLPPITLCTTAWFMSCFIGTLPIETVLRVWDSFFYEGSKTLFRIALTIFKLGEQEIRAVTDPMEIFQVVQTIPRRLVDANLVLESCFKKRGGFGGLSQEKIEVRRAERRQGYADERALAGQVGTGEVVNVRRKGVFGRRKVREAVMA